MRYYLYRFLNKERDIIYIGKTDNIVTRMKQHFGGKGHLSDDIYEDVASIEFLEFETKADMDFLELYFINTFKPVGNTKSLTVDYPKTEIQQEFNWRPLQQYENYCHIQSTLHNYKNENNEESDVEMMETKKYTLPVKRVINITITEHKGVKYLKPKDVASLLEIKQPFQFLADIRNIMGNVLMKGTATAEFRDDCEHGKTVYMKVDDMHKYLNNCIIFQTHNMQKKLELTKCLRRMK